MQRPQARTAACRSATVRVSILTRPESRVQLLLRQADFEWDEFQSSPGPKAGCNARVWFLLDTATLVSILTRPESRVQPVFMMTVGGRDVVSILTRPESRVQPPFHTARPPVVICFNPHPARKPGATSSIVSRNLSDKNVSILTRPESRVQPF